MKLIASAFVLAAACSAGLAAQTTEQTTKTKISVKDGKDVAVTGCVEPTASGGGFMLTNAADKSGSVHSYMLVSDDVDLSKYAGQRVEIKGKAADRGDAKVKMESETKTKVEHGDDRETHGKTELKGDLAGVPFLGVKEVKMIAAVCR
jgi:hypothetical protein